MSSTAKLSPPWRPARRGRPGQRVGPWRLVSLLGQGSSGTIWRAEGEAGGIAAIKLLDEPPGEELRALKSVCHPAVAQVLDAGGAPSPYVAMSRAEGRPASSLVSEGAREPEWVVRAAAVLYQALAAVHRAGVAHGDVKSANVIIEPSAPDRLVLVDFGLANSDHGGTLAFASPERLRGGPASSAADVYGAALVVWELLHGELPHARRTLSDALHLRSESAPVPSSGPDWLRELLRFSLAPEPTHRPTASDVADVFLAHGGTEVVPTPELLRTRAAAVRLPQPALEAAVDSWRIEGGILALEGRHIPSRDRAVSQVCTEVVAGGGAVLEIEPVELPWGGIERALASPTLPGEPVGLPQVEDPDARAEATAALLAGRFPRDLVVVARDYEALDAGTRAVLTALGAADQASVLLGCRAAPPEAGWVAPPVELDADGLREFVDGILGSRGGLDALYDRVEELTEGRPELVLALVVEAVRTGALAWRSQDWVVDADAALRLDLPPEAGRRPAPALDSAAEEVARWCAAAAAVLEEAELAGLVPVGSRALARALVLLERVGVVAREEGGGVRPLHGGVAALPPEDADSLAGRHRRLAERLLQRRPPPLVQIARHTALGAHAAIARAWAPELVAAIAARDPIAAVDTARQLWALAPGVELAFVRARACARVGRAEEAAEFVDKWLAVRPAAEEEAELIAIVACAQLRNEEDLLRAEAVVARCDAAAGKGPPGLELLFVRSHVDGLRGDDAGRIARIEADLPSEPPMSRDALDTWLKLRVGWAESLAALGRPSEAEACLAEVPAEIGRGLASRALVDAARSRLLWMVGRIEDAALLLEGATRPDAGLPPLERARVTNNLGAVLYESGDRGGAVRSWEQAQLLFERLDAPTDRARVLVNLCQGYTELGRWERARTAGNDARAEARGLGDGVLEAMAAGNLMSLHIACEAWADAQAMDEVASALVEEHGVGRERVELARRRAEMALLTRNPRARDYAREALAAAREEDMLLERCRASGMLAAALARDGKGEGVDDAVLAATEPLLEAGAAGVLAEVRIWAAEAYLELGRWDEALGLVQRVAVYASEIEHVRLVVRSDALEERIIEAMPESPEARDIDIVLDIARRLGRSSDGQELLDQVAEAARELLEVDRAFVLLGEDPKVVATSLHPSADRGGAPSRSVVRRAVASRREILAADLGERADLRARTSIALQELRSVLTVPMWDGDEWLGLIDVDSRRHARRRLGDAADRLRALAALAAVGVVQDRAHQAELLEVRMSAEREVLERTHEELADLAADLAGKNRELERLNEELRRSAMTDSLTGVGNRRRFVADVEASHARLLRGGAPYAVILGDLDRFKRVNDEHGHLVGDRLLTAIATAMQDRLRAGDRLYRYGGEEFAVLVTEAGPGAEMMVAERLRVAVEEVAGDEAGPLPAATMSFGTACAGSEPPATWDALLGLADEALYRAKAGGRNRVDQTLSGD